MTKKLLVALVGLLTLLLLPSRAAALTYKPITEEELKAMADRIVAVGSASDEKEEMKDLIAMARRVRPIVELVDARCPMPVKVANGTAVPLFNVEITVSERRGTTGPRVPQSLHIPYIPAKSVVSGNIACAIPTTTYGYQAYGERNIYMSAGPVADHSRLDDEGIAKMLRTNVDTSTVGVSFEASGGGATARLAALEGAIGRGDAGAPSPFDSRRPNIIPTILEELGGTLHAVDFKFFVLGLLRSEGGAGALGTWLSSESERQSEVMPLLAGAQPAKLRALLHEMMRRSTDTTLSPLTSSALGRVCGAGQPEAERTSLWLAALGKDVASTTIRTAVLDKCGVGKEQTRARLKAAKPEQLGRALDGMTGDLFDIAVGAMTESKSFGAASTLLSETSDITKFEPVARAALTFVTPTQREQLLRTLATIPPGKIAPAKAKWVSSQLDDLHGRGADAPILQQLLGDMAQGRMQDPSMRKVVYPRWKDAGKSAFDPFMTELATRPTVLAPAWVRARAEAGQIDLVDLLAKVGGGSVVRDAKAADENDDEDVATLATSLKATPNTAQQSVCYGSATEGLKCLEAVRDLSLTKEALEPKWVDAAIEFVRIGPAEEMPQKLAKTLAAMGVDMTPAADALCKAAPRDRRPNDRWSYSESHDPLATANVIAPNHPCIASVMAARSSAARTYAGGVVLRLMLALVPFGLVGWFAKKRFVPVRAQLEKESLELEAVRGQAGLSVRLARPQTEEALGAGMSDAATFLAGDSREDIAAAGRALRALSPERRTALLTQARSLVQRAAETGNAATTLAELDGLVLYLACFPGREDQPQAVRRHPGFTEGWTTHMDGIVTACVADGRPGKVLSLVFMLGAAGDKTTMLVGYDTPVFHFVPDSLAGSRTEHVTHDHRYELHLGAS